MMKCNMCLNDRSKINSWSMCLNDRSKINSWSELYESTLFRTGGNFQEKYSRSVFLLEHRDL